MSNQWQMFFEKFPDTVTSEQLPVKLPRFDLDLCELAGAAADWCLQYLKDRKCPYDLIVLLTKKVISNLRVQWTADPKFFGYRPEKEDYQALWLMQRVIGELNKVCMHDSVFLHDQRTLVPVWWSSFVLKNVRRQMEDYIAVIPYLHTLFDVKSYNEASFYAVYDGHNGLDAAVYSSMYFHQYLVQSVHYPTNAERALYEAFFSTDEGFTKKNEKYNLVSGTTAVCALIRPEEKKLYVGWVGDSIATLWKNGTPLCLVNKHVPERPDETQRIQKEGGMVTQCQGIWRVDGQLAVSRAIGDDKYKPHITCQPEIRVLVLDGNEEFLVLGSDGLWEHITPEDVAETIYDELLETDGDVSGVGNKLALKSKAEGSKDNISVITVFLQDPKVLVAKRRAVIMETAMEQRNATATLASYGQDTGDFGPETDVDTPDEPIGLSKPKIEGEANVIDESGEDSEEDGGGWNYYKKPTEDSEKKTDQENDQNTGTNSDTEDMDYKLNPDAPEFVPVASPTLSVTNLAQRFVDTDNFISSSPQKFKESIDNVDVPDENDFTNEIKVHAADLSKLDNAYEPSDNSTTLNGIKPLSDELTSHNETDDNFIIQNEQISSENEVTYTNPFASDDKVDLNKVQDLSEYLDHNDDQTLNVDPFVSIMETSKNNEFRSTSCDNELNSTSCDNEIQNELNMKSNDDLSEGEHIQYEQDMNSKNIDDTINISDATAGSTLQLDDESFKHNDDFKNDFMDHVHNEKFDQFEDRKLNDSVSTTDAIQGSEPHTPMRMDNQSTFESENDDDQFSETFKQHLQFNQFDEHNDKENHDPFCFTEDPAGIIPNVTREANEVDETHQIADNVIPNESSSDQIPESTKHEPVEEPLCVKEEAKPIHSVYEQQDLPESDFSASTHEALLNAPDNEFNHHDNIVSTGNFEHEIIEHQFDDKDDQVKNKSTEQFKVSSHPTDDLELDDSDVDEVKDHVEGLQQQFDNDNNTFSFEQNNYSVNDQSESLVPKHYNINDELECVKDFKQEDQLSNNLENNLDNNFENYLHHQNDLTKMSFDNIKQEHSTLDADQEHQNSVDRVITNSVEDLREKDHFCVEATQNRVENIVEAVQSNVEEQEHPSVLQVENNYVNDFKHDDVAESINSPVEDIKPESDHFSETALTHENSQPLNHETESVQNQVVESDEEMHSSMIIHADVENNMPQPYCSSHDTLMNEPDMMCTSMTFEENFQNRNMSDSLYVMETSSDYFGEEVHQTAQLDTSVSEPNVKDQILNNENNPVDVPKVEEQILNSENVLVESPVQVENESATETQSELISESNAPEVKAESNQSLLQEPAENVDKQEESSKVAEIAVATVAGAAAVAAVTGVALASKKPAPKKAEMTISKAKTTATKTSPTKPLASKTAPIAKKTTTTTTTKPLSRTTTAPSTSKPTTNVRPTTVPKTTTLKTTTVTKAAPKPAVKTTAPTPRPTSAKTTPTTPRTTTMTKTTPTSSPKTPTTLKTATTPKLSTTPKTSTTPRTSTLVSKQSLTNGSPKPLSRPISAPAKKSLSSSTTNGTTKLMNGSTKMTNGTTRLNSSSSKLTNGTTKLTNGDVSKTSTTTKPPVSLATRMSLAPPKLPPKAKVAPKTVPPPAMPGPIRRPKAPSPKKTDMATS